MSATSPLGAVGALAAALLTVLLLQRRFGAPPPPRRFAALDGLRGYAVKTLCDHVDGLHAWGELLGEDDTRTAGR